MNVTQLAQDRLLVNRSLKMPSFTISATQAAYDEYKPAFLEACPVPLDPETHQPVMSDDAWVKKSILVLFCREKYIEGKKKLAVKKQTLTNHKRTTFYQK
jgi:hypothetical protein